MRLLISDANILIDMEEGRLIEQMFCLPWTFGIPDILFFEELQAQHAYLRDQGLQVCELTPDSTLYAFQLSQRCIGPSRNDCFALALARQEMCPLLTGDRALRSLADGEQVEAKGTIWLVEQLMIEKIITPQEAHRAYIHMRENARRLPWALVEKSLAGF